MQTASNGAQPAPERAFVEFRVRAHTTYEVTQYTGETSGGSVMQVASNLSKPQAEKVIEALARAFPDARITRLREDERTFTLDEVMVSDPQGILKPIHQRLLELPFGSKIIFTAARVRPGENGRNGLVQQFLVPISTDPPEESASQFLDRLGDNAQAWAKEFCKRFPMIEEGDMIGWFANAIEHSTCVRQSRKDRPDWSINGMTYGEVEDAKAMLGRLPYDVAAAMRRNARESGDAVMLLLLDEAKVAVDA